LNKLNDDGYDIAREMKELNCIGSESAMDVALNFASGLYCHNVIILTQFFIEITIRRANVLCLNLA